MTTVTDTRTGADSDLAHVLASLMEQKRTGTLKLVGDDGRLKYIYFKRGTVELLKTNRSKTLLGKALLKRRKLTQEQLEAALERQKAASHRLRLGEILVGMGTVLESDVQQALAYQIAEEIFELFTWDRMQSDFYRGEPPLDIFETEDLQSRVSLSPVHLSREAVRRHKELNEIRRVLPSMKDVYAPTAQAYQTEKDQNPAFAEVMSCLDGQRTVEELLEVVRAPDMVAMRVLVKMKQDGDAIALSGQDLLTLAQELEDRGEFDRAKRRYLRAEELGLPDFDLPRRIGQIAEALGDMNEACRRYQTYADRCDQAGYPDVAAMTLARVLDLDGDQLTARERYAELLAKLSKRLGEEGDPQAQAKLGEAAAQYELLLGKTRGAEDKRRILSALSALQPDRDDLREHMVAVSLELGDKGQAIEEYQEIAMAALQADELERAVGVLEKILEIEPGEILALQSLAATYARLGRVDESVEYYLHFAQTFEESGLAEASPETLVDIYEKVIELQPANTEARRFLAEAYGDREEAGKAIAHYRGMLASLREPGNEEDLLEVLDKLAELKALDVDLAMERARVGRKLGRGEEGLSVYRSAAEGAMLAGDSQAAQVAWKELLALNPGDLEAHLALAKIELEARDPAAGRRCEAVFELALVAGREDLADEAVKRALDHEPDNPHHRERLARIYALHGREADAARALVRAARAARDDENFGQARVWARRALELDDGCADARDLLENLRRAAIGGGAQSSPQRQADPDRATIAATISGGPQRATIEGLKAPTRKISGIMDKLRQVKMGGGAPNAPETLRLSEASPRDDASTRKLSKKANSAMDRLKALRSGGGKSGESSGESAVSKGPEAAGDAADAVVSKKANSAMSKLKALRSGGGTSGEPSGESAVSKGPEAAGDAADTVVSKKANSAMSKLKALRSGGGGGGASASSEQPVSKGPEAAGDAADAVVSKKANSAMSKLKALRSGGGDSSASSEQPVSKGPEASGDVADEVVAKKASSAMDRLKALRSGGAKPSPSAAGKTPISKGPEAPGDTADQAVSKKASSAMDRLKALRAGKGEG